MAHKKKDKIYDFDSKAGSGHNADIFGDVSDTTKKSTKKKWGLLD